MPYNLPPFSSSTPCLLKRSVYCPDGIVCVDYGFPLTWTHLEPFCRGQVPYRGKMPYLSCNWNDSLLTWFDSIKYDLWKKFKQFIQIFLLVFLTDNPLRVVGIFPAKNEKKILWKLLYDLYSSTSIYSYGRVQLNMFIAEKEYEVGY